MKELLRPTARHDAELRYTQFRPATLSDFFAFQIARKLDDAIAARHYAELCERYGEDQMFFAFRRVANIPADDRARQFHRELENPNGVGSIPSLSHLPFAAIRVERRSVSIVVMRGFNPEHIQFRQLSSDPDKALASALGFVNRVVEWFPFQSAAIEVVPEALDIQRAQMTAGIIRTLREQSVTFWEIPKQELLVAFGYPTLRSRGEVRNVVVRIWPFFDPHEDRPYVRDAAALGLYCQIERRFIT